MTNTAAKIAIPETCQYCGCTETAPCITDVGPCAWADEFHTVCSNPVCIGCALDDGLEEELNLEEEFDQA